MKKTFPLLIFIVITTGCNTLEQQAFKGLPEGVQDTYPLWRINNGDIINTNGGFNLIFSEDTPDTVAIDNWEEVLNGSNRALLACKGKLVKNEKAGFVVGTSRKIH